MSGGITRNYNDQPMSDLTEPQYDTLLGDLSEQVASKLRRAGWPEDEVYKHAVDVLTNEWLGTLTAREWLAAVGRRTGVDMFRVCWGITAHQS